MKEIPDLEKVKSRKLVAISPRMGMDCSITDLRDVLNDGTMEMRSFSDVKRNMERRTEDFSNTSIIVISTLVMDDLKMIDSFANNPKLMEANGLTVSALFTETNSIYRGKNIRDFIHWSLGHNNVKDSIWDMWSWLSTTIDINYKEFYFFMGPDTILTRM